MESKYAINNDETGAMMAKEIERKFLINREKFKPQDEGKYIAQGYLSTNINSTVRVRIKDNCGYLTIKGKNEGIMRSEFEYEIPLYDAQELLNLCQTAIIAKRRYTVEYKGKTWEIDIFEGDNAGLMIAEIELAAEDEAFDKPEWLGDEVSFDSRFYNSNLSKKPYKNW